MDWRVKAVVQGTASLLPASERLNSLLQRISGSYALSPDKVPASVAYARRHLEHVARWSPRAVDECRYFEFGAGWGLQGPIAMYLLGAGPQTVVDLHRHVRPGFIETVLDVHRKSPTADAARVVPAADAGPMTIVASMDIDYRAPADARETGFDPASLDVVTSTNTLEHIPPEDIGRILDEVHRILAPEGVMSLQIDYKDHHSYSDASISPYHFLQHGPLRWKLVNNDLQFQNRLRHHEYLELLDRHGFDVVEVDVVEASAIDLEVLEALDLDPGFADLDLAAVGRKEAFIVAQPRV